MMIHLSKSELRVLAAYVVLVLVMVVASAMTVPVHVGRFHGSGFTYFCHLVL